MKTSTILLTIGLLANLIAFSQSIKADKKIDSFYCFGPTKAKELAKMQSINDAKDSANAEMQDELDHCEYIVHEYQEAYRNCTNAESIAAAQLQHKDVQIESKESENAGLRKELKVQKRKSFWSSVATAGSLALNVILGVKLAVK